MNLIATFLLGILVAIGSLILQVFFTTLTELFFHTNNLTYQYSPADTTTHILVLMLFSASIEEGVRYFFIKKQISTYTQNLNIWVTFLYGVLFGIGFASLEGLLLYLGNTSLSIIFNSFLPIILIHVFASTFLIFTIKKTSKMSMDLLYVAIAISFHICCNYILYTNLL